MSLENENACSYWENQGPYRHSTPSNSVPPRFDEIFARPTLELMRFQPTNVIPGRELPDTFRARSAIANSPNALLIGALMKKYTGWALHVPLLRQCNAVSEVAPVLESELD